MAHIQFPAGLPGILGPMAFSPETARPLNALAEVLLRGPNSLSQADREMIATYVSAQNDCYFCQNAHGAVAAHHLGGNETLIQQMKGDFEGDYTAVYSPPVWPRFPPPKAPNIWTSLTPLNCYTSILHTIPLCWTTENRGIC